MIGPYIGIAGFTDPEEILAVLQVFPHDSKLKLGVLATCMSSGGFSMQPIKISQTLNSNLLRLFLNDDRVVNLVRLSSEQELESSTFILADMIGIHKLAGPNFHGFQLNLTWPETRLVDDYRMTFGYKYYLALQIGQKAIKEVGGTPEDVAERLYDYGTGIDGILLNLNGELGEPPNTERAESFLSAIAKQQWDLDIGITGQFNSDSLSFLKPLLVKFPGLSINSQWPNHFNLDEVRKYILGLLTITS